MKIKIPLSQIDWEGSVLKGRQHEQCELRHSLSKPKSREISTQNLRRMEPQASPETAGLVL